MNYFFLIGAIMINTMNLSAQYRSSLTAMPSLPGDKGWAGMYAGVSKGILFCMGGANFPDKYPWEGGKKKWYEDIYMLKNGEKWVSIPQKLPFAMAYGVSVSYKEGIIIIGGSNESRHFKEVFFCNWSEKGMVFQRYPDLPAPLANMTGALLNNLIIIAGGNSAPSEAGIKKCFALDLEDMEKGWFEFPPIPGAGRIQPICATYKDKFYLFSGETSAVNALKEKYSLILQDAYSLTPKKEKRSWTGTWTTLSPMPKGASAAGAPIPVLKEGEMVFWGGVDAISLLHKDPRIFPGISGEKLIYRPDTDSWQYGGEEKKIPARVTLPVVYWNGKWVFISGEVKPGIRTNTVIGMSNPEMMTK